MNSVYLTEYCSRAVSLAFDALTVAHSLSLSSASVFYLGVLAYAGISFLVDSV